MRFFRILSTRLHSRKNTLFQISSVKSFSASTQEFLQIPESAENGPARQISYKKLDGTSTPGVVYIPGFRGHSGGLKPMLIAELCQQNDIPFVTYDPTGLGESKSSGLDWHQSHLGHWINDAHQVISRLTQGPQLIVGSSMGCWISCLLAQRYPKHFGAMLLISPAMNFGPHYLAKLEQQLPESLVKKLHKGEVVELYMPDYGSIPLQMSLFESMIRNEAPQDPGTLHANCPVRIIFSMKDVDVPYPSVQRLFASFSHDDVQLQLLKGGSHTFHEPENLALISNSLLRLRQHTAFGGSGENTV